MPSLTEPGMAHARSCGANFDEGYVRPPHERLPDFEKSNPISAHQTASTTSNISLLTLAVEQLKLLPGGGTGLS